MNLRRAARGLVPCVIRRIAECPKKMTWTHGCEFGKKGNRIQAVAPAGAEFGAGARVGELDAEGFGEGGGGVAHHLDHAAVDAL